MRDLKDREADRIGNTSSGAGAGFSGQNPSWNRFFHSLIPNNQQNIHSLIPNRTIYYFCIYDLYIMVEINKIMDCVYIYDKINDFNYLYYRFKVYIYDMRF